MRHYAAKFRLFLGLGALVVVVMTAKNLPAGFYVESTDTSVEIDGINYGTFSNVSGLELKSKIEGESPDSHMRVTLRRDFVTDPSLYLWARNVSSQRQGLKNIHLVKKNSDGEEIERLVLKFCQPLSWTVEAANPALGGFHETVDIAVQAVENL